MKGYRNESSQVASSDKRIRTNFLQRSRSVIYERHNSRTTSMSDAELRSMFDGLFSKNNRHKQARFHSVSETSDCETQDLKRHRYSRSSTNSFTVPIPADIQRKMVACNKVKCRPNASSVRKPDWEMAKKPNWEPSKRELQRRQSSESKTSLKSYSYGPAFPSFWISFSYMESDRKSLDMRLRYMGHLPRLHMPMFSKLSLEMTVNPGTSSASKRRADFQNGTSDNQFQTTYVTFPLSKRDITCAQQSKISVRFRVVLNKLFSKEIVSEWNETLQNCKEQIVTQWHMVDFHNFRQAGVRS